MKQIIWIQNNKIVPKIKDTSKKYVGQFLRIFALM